MALFFAFQIIQRRGYETAMLLAVSTIYLGLLALRACRLAAGQERAEREISRQSAVISLLLNDLGGNCGDWLWETDADGLIVHVSQCLPLNPGERAYALRGKTVATAMGGDAGDADWARLTDAMAMHAAVRGLLVGARRDKAQTWWRMTARPVFGSCGNFKGYRGAARDVTQEREQVSGLQAAIVRAERASERKADYLQTVGQELRTPLNAIAGFAEVLSSDRADTIEDDVRHDFLRIIADNSRRMQDVVRNLLDFTSLEKGTLRIVEQDVDAADLIEVVAGLCQGAAEAADVTIVVHVLDGLEIRVDVARMKQVLAGMIRAAIDSSPAGGNVIVSLEYEAGRGLCFAVSDRGTGYSGGAAAATGQTTPGRSFDIEGDLSFSRRIALLHGGDLVFNRAAGAGTTARLLLPDGRVTAHWMQVEAG